MKTNTEEQVGAAAPTFVKDDSKGSKLGYKRLQGKAGVSFAFDSLLPVLDPLAKKVTRTHPNVELLARQQQPRKGEIKSEETVRNGDAAMALYVIEAYPQSTTSADPIRTHRNRLAKLKVRFKREEESWTPVDLFSCKGNPAVLHKVVDSLAQGSAFAHIPLGEIIVSDLLVD